MNCIGLILGAGEGTRMKSELPKVMHKAAGNTLIKWVLEAVKPVVSQKCIVVYGSGGDILKEYLDGEAEFVMQSVRLGSGHAVMCATEKLEGKEGYVLVLAGDMPLITTKTLQALKEAALKHNVDACILSSIADDPSGYGRIIRDKDGSVIKITEDKDATAEQKKIKEINSGIYCFKISSLLGCLSCLKPVNAQGEYYLTDCIEYIHASGGRVDAILTEDKEECSGVNNRVQLAYVAKILRQRILKKLMLNGVTIIDPDNTYIDAEVLVGMDTVVYPGVMLEGKCEIGKGVMLYPGSRIKDSIIGDGTQVQNSVIIESRIGKNTTVGPYAYLRPNSDIGDNCRIGDFVEVKNSEIKDGAKVPHLSYIGDGYIGEKTNIGCGTVFVNYDGVKKYRTVVQKDVFVGCNSNLVAPVEIGHGAYIAAGSTVTEDVPENTLCIARSRQVIKTDWKNKKRKD